MSKNLLIEKFNLPSQWKIERLENLCRQIVDGTHHTPKYTDFGVPFLRVTDVQGATIDLDRIKYVSKEEHKVLVKRCHPKSGDILLSKNGTIGIPKVVDWDWDFSIFVSLALIKLKNDIDAYYLYHFLKSNLTKWQVKRRAKQGTVTNLHLEEIREFEIPILPLPQQKKIAKILSTCDTVIEKTEAAIAKYQALKQGLMHDLFTRGIHLETGKLRPTYQDAPELYKKSVLGWIPKEWDEGQFIDFANENIHYSFTGGPFGSDLQSKDYKKEGVRIIQLQNIGDGHFNNGYKIFTSEEKANQLRACNIYPGEIILSKMADPIARACIIPNNDERYLMASDGIRLSIDKRRFNGRFVLETINQSRFRNMAELRSTGTTRSRIGLTELKEIPIVYPSYKEQSLIGNKLDALENNIDNQKEILTKYQKLKAGLMQDLLTGKVLVNTEEKLKIYEH